MKIVTVNERKQDVSCDQTFNMLTMSAVKKSTACFFPEIKKKRSEAREKLYQKKKCMSILL